MREKPKLTEFLRRHAPLVLLFIIFISAFWLRSFPARFGELQALDPFFFYRMGVEAMENNWQLGLDMMRYHPSGIDTLQYHYVLPIYLPAMVYAFLSMLGMNMHYLSFAILWPAALGALAVIPMYLLGRELFNSRKAGLFAAFFLATVPAFITRTSAGFFEKEPIAGFFILTSVYFFVRAFRRGSWISGVIAGSSLAITSLAWGGVQYIYMLYAGFLAMVFLANGIIVVLDYLFSGFGNLLKTLDRYMDINMIKAYAPLIFIGTLTQQFFARRIDISHISIIVSFGLIGILVARYGAERFNLVKREYLPYVVPAIIVLAFAGLLVGSMFSDYVGSRFSQVTGLLTFGKSVITSTVAENAPGNWNNVVSTTGTGFSTAILPQFSSVSPYLAIWLFMLLGVGLLVYRFFRTRDWFMLFPVIWVASGIVGVYYFVRLIFLVGPPAALVSGFFMAWVVDRAMRLKIMNRVREAEGLRGHVNIVSLLLVALVALVLAVNFASAYAYSLNLGPSICFPRYNGNDPFDVQPCITIDENGNEVMSPNQPWYEAFTHLAEQTPEGSSVLSWWDFGYWFQVRGERPSIADGGHTGGSYTETDYQVAEWYVDNVENWENYSEWFEDRDVDYILMDYTLPGKYGAISKIASRGQQIVGFLQFNQKGVEPRGNETVYVFSNGPYEIWLPLDQSGNLAGTPMFLVKRDGQYVQKSYINEVCTSNGIIKAGDKSPSIPGCVSISDLGVYYVPPEAEHSIFNSLMFMEGTGLSVEKVFDNKLVIIYRLLRGGETVSGTASAETAAPAETQELEPASAPEFLDV